MIAVRGYEAIPSFVCVVVGGVFMYLTYKGTLYIVDVIWSMLYSLVEITKHATI